MTASRLPRRSGAQTREAILDAAERLFAASGYRGTSLEEIGREAGLSRGTPGYFFRSKHRLYGEVLERILLRAESALGPAYARARRDDPDVEALLMDLVGAHLGLLAREPSVVRLIQWEALDKDARIIVELGVRAQPLVALIQDLSVRSGHGALDEDAAIELLMNVAALCWFPLAHADSVESILGRNPRSPDAIASQTRRIVRFVLGRLAERRPAQP